MIYRDEQQAREAEDRLLDAHVRKDPFAAAFKATRIPMIIADPAREDNPIIFCNTACEALTGYSRNEVVGQNCRFLQGPDTSAETVTRIREAIGAGEDVAVDILNYRKDGSAFWNALFISPVRDDDDTVVYYFASLIDLTNIKNRESELAAARHQAEQEVAERTAELRATLVAKTILVHEVDHRVKNNLSTMASIVKLQARLTKDEGQKRTLMAVLNRVEALSTVQRKLFTRADVSSFDVADFTRELVTDLVNAIKRNDVRMTLDLSPVLIPAVKASPLSLIVNELVGDAVRRGLSEGGGNIHVVVKQLNGHFFIRVEDTSDDVDVDGESAEFGRLLLEASARQLGATINRMVEGRRVTVEVKLLVNEEQEPQQ